MDKLINVLFTILWFTMLNICVSAYEEGRFNYAYMALLFAAGIAFASQALIILDEIIQQKDKDYDFPYKIKG